MAVPPVPPYKLWPSTLSSDLDQMFPQGAEEKTDPSDGVKSNAKGLPLTDDPDLPHAKGTAPDTVVLLSSGKGKLILYSFKSPLYMVLNHSPNKMSLKNKSGSNEANTEPMAVDPDPEPTEKPRQKDVAVSSKSNAEGSAPPTEKPKAQSSSSSKETVTEVSLSSGKGKFILYSFQITPLYECKD